MRTLYLLRHAKSDWDDERLDDHERPLAPRGERACERIGRWLAGSSDPPQRALCSSARRAVDTLERIAPHLVERPAVSIDRALYLATPSEMLGRIGRVEPSVERLILVGHNPGMHQLAHELVGGGDVAAAERLARKFPTAALAKLRFDADDWAGIDAGDGELLDFVTPRELAGG